jgi:hypothetical protein
LMFGNARFGLREVIELNRRHTQEAIGFKGHIATLEGFIVLVRYGAD